MPKERLRLFVSRVNEFPYTHAAAIATIAASMNMIYRQGFDPFGIVLIAAIAIVGAILTFVGLSLIKSAYLSYGLERVGQFLLGGAWLTYSIVYFYIYGSPYAMVMYLALGLAGLIKAIRLSRKMKEIRDTVKAVRKRVEE